MEVIAVIFERFRELLFRIFSFFICFRKILLFIEGWVIYKVFILYDF